MCNTSWIPPPGSGPFEPGNTPYALVKEAAELIVASGLKAEALHDARPAQWSKLIFNASVNGVSALDGIATFAALCGRIAIL